jgi:hypothetical protein
MRNNIKEQWTNDKQAERLTKGLPESSLLDSFILYLLYILLYSHSFIYFQHKFLNREEKGEKEGRDGGEEDGRHRTDLLR